MLIVLCSNSFSQVYFKYVMSVGVNLVGLRDTVKSRSSQVQSAESKYFKFEPLNKLTT